MRSHGPGSFLKPLLPVSGPVLGERRCVSGGQKKRERVLATSPRGRPTSRSVSHVLHPPGPKERAVGLASAWAEGGESARSQAVPS